MKDELQKLPAVGPSIAVDLRQLGVRSIRDRRGGIRSGCTLGSVK